MSKKKYTVLIVDDQKTNITLLTDMMSSEYNVFSAENGQDGIKAANDYLPDVILLDILMMDMDGYAVLDILKSSERTKDIPVIFITSLQGDDNEAKGLLMGASDYITKPFSPVIVLLRLRNQIKLLEQMRAIEKLSMHDHLTELPNRRSFEERINTEWNRAIRDKSPVSILMIDVDLFKRYNDNYGHQQGDVVLKTIAKCFIEELKRPGDFAARWGGEEFIVLLPCTVMPGALDVAERIRRRIEEVKIPCSDNDKLAEKVTVSIGAYTREQNQECTINEFITRADTALYDAKKKGRNRVCFFGEE
ncbi:MAG: diguanylate cyclase [Treponema sp.]|nr:diguanylate cyclase [Treponema sp.]